MQYKTEREKMLDGELYLATDAELAQMNLKARQQIHLFNLSPVNEEERQRKIIVNLFAQIGTNFTVRPPFYCDYGCHIFAGDNLYSNSHNGEVHLTSALCLLPSASKRSTLYLMSLRTAIY